MTYVVVENITSVAALDRIASRHTAGITVLLFYRPDVPNNMTCLYRYRDMVNSERAQAVAKGPRPVFFAAYDLQTGSGDLQDRFGGPDLPLCAFFVGHTVNRTADKPVERISGMDMILVQQTIEELCKRKY